MVNRRIFSVSNNRFSRNAQQTFKLALAVILSLFLYRIFMLIYFKSSLAPDLAWNTYLAALINGLRYDAVVAGYITAVPFIFALLSLFIDLDRANSRLRTFFLFFYTVAAAFLLLSHFLFYLEFNHNFNHLALGIIYDDRKAVLMTAWHQYPMAKALAIAVLGACGLIWGTLRFINRPLTRNTPPIKRKPALNLFTGLLWIALFAVLIRGSFGPRPVEPKDAAITGDAHMNSHIVNPFMAAAYTLEDHIKMKNVNGVDAFLQGGTIHDAVARYFNQKPNPDLDTLLIQHAKGGTAQPKHIFLIVMESMDAWDLLNQYQSFDLLPNLKALGREGILLRKFISASNGTMSSLAAIITGLPDVKVITNYQPSSRKPYPTSIAVIFKNLGYKTRFFYGGYLSWQRIQDFCQSQGFEEIYGGGSMGQWRSREWGVDDNTLFNFVESKTDSLQPTFDIILSTSYHSPYDIDLDQWGFPYKTFPPELENQKTSVSLKVFGHLWYTDKVLGRFIRDVRRQHPQSVFAVTGDHRSHNYINPSTYTLYEQMAVPLLLYGMDLKLNPDACNRIAGSHMDIAPTLIELAAPKGFAYHTLGSDLLDPGRVQQGIGCELMITPNAMVDMYGKSTSIPFEELSTDAVLSNQPNQLAQKIRDYYAIGWWRIMKGADLQATGGREGYHG